MKPVSRTLPVVLAEGKRALQSLALALMCFTLEDTYVIVLATDWLVLGPWSLPTTREPGSAALPCAQKVESQKYVVNGGDYEG